MRVTKDKPPTDAQARRLAVLWGDSRMVQVGGYLDPTLKVLLLRGWLDPVDKFGEYPNGEKWRGFSIASSGIGALATYFINKAHGK